MKITDEIKQKVITAILDYLSTVSSASRTDLINGALMQYGFSKEEISEKGDPTAKVNLIRSYIGTSIANLTANKSIKTDANKKYQLVKEKLVVVEESQCRAKIFQLLQSKPLSKSQLLSALQKSFGTDKTSSKMDDNAVKQIAGTILGEEVSKGNLILEKDNYSLPVAKIKKTYPNGACFGRNVPGTVFGTPLRYGRRVL